MTHEFRKCPQRRLAAPHTKVHKRDASCSKIIPKCARFKQQEDLIATSPIDILN